MPLALGEGSIGSKDNFFQNTVMLQIKLEGIIYSATLKQTFCMQTPDPGGGSIGQNSTLFRTWSCCKQRGNKYLARRPHPQTQPDPRCQRVKI